MTKRDWWLGIAFILLAIVVHVLLPRYELRQNGATFVRLDRWTGAVHVSRWTNGKPVLIESTVAPSLLTVPVAELDQ